MITVLLKKRKLTHYSPFLKKKKSYFLNNPYESDITYHVDFEKIKQQAIKSGLFFYGPITQKKFLFFNGINERFIKLSRGLQSKKQFKILDSQFTRLTDAKGMGDLIKCVFISKKELELNFFWCLKKIKLFFVKIFNIVFSQGMAVLVKKTSVL